MLLNQPNPIYKVHLVVQGFSQKPSTNYSKDSMFVPVMHFRLLQTLLAFAAVNNLKLCQFNIKGAYLQCYINQVIYMMQLPEYDNGTPSLCHLIHSLYGLQQAGNVWNQELNKALNTFRFMQLKLDYCCYI